jgi:hypothetical protein
VQAGRRRAAGVAGGEPAEHGTAGHGGAGPDRDRERLVGGAQAAGMVDRDDTAAGQHTGVDHQAGAGREHCVAGRAGQVNPPMPRPVRISRRVERARHRRPSRQRPSPPHPDLPTATGQRRRARRARLGQEDRPGQRARPGQRGPGDRPGRGGDRWGSAEAGGGGHGQRDGEEEAVPPRAAAGPPVGRVPRAAAVPRVEGVPRAAAVPRVEGVPRAAAVAVAVPPRAEGVPARAGEQSHAATVRPAGPCRGGGMSGLWMERAGVDRDLALLAG